jgi:hypothetical protein
MAGATMMLLPVIAVLTIGGVVRWRKRVRGGALP